MCLHIYKTFVVYRIFLQHEAGGIHRFTADNRLLANSDLTDLRRQTGFTMKHLWWPYFLKNQISYTIGPYNSCCIESRFDLYGSELCFLKRAPVKDQNQLIVQTTTISSFSTLGSVQGLSSMHGLIEIFQAKDELGHEHCGYHSLGRHDNWQNLNILMVN
jgi:hypothetical protein